MLRTLTLAAALTAALPAAAQPASVAGRWVTQDGKAIVEIAPCGASICGRIAKVLSTEPGRPTTDVNNPDAKLRSRPILGMTILSGFAPSGSSWKGQIYDPKSGSTYRSYLTIDGGQLKVQGCIGPFCQTQRWKRAG